MLCTYRAADVNAAPHSVIGRAASTAKEELSNQCSAYLSESGRRIAAQELCGRGHLLFAHQEALVIALHASNQRDGEVLPRLSRY